MNRVESLPFNFAGYASDREGGIQRSRVYEEELPCGRSARHASGARSYREGGILRAPLVFTAIAGCAASNQCESESSGRHARSPGAMLKYDAVLGPVQLAPLWYQQEHAVVGNFCSRDVNFARSWADDASPAEDGP